MGFKGFKIIKVCFPDDKSRLRERRERERERERKRESPLDINKLIHGSIYLVLASSRNQPCDLRTSPLTYDKRNAFEFDVVSFLVFFFFFFFLFLDCDVSRATSYGVYIFSDNSFCI